MPRSKQQYTATFFRENKSGIWRGRLVLRLPNGEEIKRQCTAKTKSECREKLDKLKVELLTGKLKPADIEALTFANLAEQYKTAQLIPAEYRDGRKIVGLKHPQEVRNRLKHVVDYFGNYRLREITVSAIKEYKLHLIRTPKLDGNPRGPVDINHHLRVLRQCLNFAVEKEYIPFNPCSRLRGFINPADEKPRQRPEHGGEIERLLEQCTGRRLHIRYWIIASVEIAARVSEISRLERRDLDFDKKLICIRETVSKTQEERLTPMSELLEQSLREWFEVIEKDPYWRKRIHDFPNAKIFGSQKTNYEGFISACKDAGIKDLRRQDLRHWGTTRLVGALARLGISHLHAMKITGHRVERTFRRYITTDEEVVQSVRNALNTLRKTGNGT